MKKVLTLLIIVLTIMLPITVHAEKTIGQIEKELNQKQSDLEKNKKEKEENIKNIDGTKKEIGNITSQMKEIQDSIDKKNQEIEGYQININKKNEEIKNLMRYYQVSSSGSALLEYVMGAKSLTDLIYRLSITEQISSYNKKVIGEMNDLIDETNKAKKELASKEEEMKKLQASLNTQLSKLNDDKASLDSDAKTLSQEINDMQTILKNLKARGCSSSETQTSCYARLAREAAARQKRSSGSSSSAGAVDVPTGYSWYRPLVSSYIVSQPGYRASFGKYHMGTDYSASRGTPAYAVANGTVGYIKNGGDTCGNQVFIWSTVNGQKYTEWYCHLSSISVSIGQEVNKNTVIGLVGNTGAEYYTGGFKMQPHLHVAVGTGWYYRDYISGFSSRVKTLSSLAPGLFPAVGVRWNGR